MERPGGRSSQLFVQAADLSGNPILNSPYLSFSNSAWTPYLAMYLEHITTPLILWFKPVCVCVALCWLIYRAYCVLNQPLEDLASLLGFDIPPTPTLALADLKADGAIIHWSLPGDQKSKSSSKYEIWLNGESVGTVPAHESAATILGLQPDYHYIVRVALVSHLDFSSKSSPARFRTRSASTNDYFQTLHDGHDTEHDGTHEPLIRVKPYHGLKDITPASADVVPPSLAREGSSAMSRKRSNTNRRVSPAMVNESRDEQEAAAGHVDGETMIELTERLDALRREHENAEHLARAEEEEDTRLRDELIAERDRLRAEVAEREKASRNLKREVTAMERQNTIAQNERSKAERILQQKIEERQKHKDDNVRWMRETEEMKVETEHIKQEQKEYAIQAETQMATLDEQLATKFAAIKMLEDDIRDTNAEIKKVERSVANPSPSGSEPAMSLVEQLQHDAEEDRQWQLRNFELHQQYTAAAKKLETAKSVYYHHMTWLESLREKRRQDEAAAAASSVSRDMASPSNGTERLPSRRDSQRSRRGNSGHGINESPRTHHYGPVQQSAFGNTTGFASTPIFAFNNPAAITELAVPEEDRDRLTGGALMSPGAGEGLLPADLFNSEDKSMDTVQPLPGLGSLPGMSGLSGLGQTPAHDAVDQSPASPASVSSRAASTFASPQASQQNLHYHLGSPEAFTDTDGRSIRSNRSGRATSGGNTGSRFSTMFGIRPRLKNSSLDDNLGGPLLNKTHSHSMPRQDNGTSGLDNAVRKRNSSLSVPTFEDGDADSVTVESVNMPIQAKRPFRLNPFNRDKGIDGWPAFRRPTSPRPGSTHSGELPRPSFDSSRWGADAWPSTDSGTGARASPLSLGGWNAPQNSSRTFLPGFPSRRASLQYGSSGPPEDILEDDGTDILDDDDKPPLAPIGTKPAKGKKVDKQAENKLNPNAKDFKSFFPSMRRDKNKGEGSSSRTGASSSSTPLGKDSVDEDSPPQSRKSRDALSTTTLESSLAESRRPSNELVLSPTYSQSDTSYSPQIGTGSFGKESFMHKIARKSSSSKFSLPTFKREKSRLDATGSPSVPPVEDEEDAMSASVGSLREARESSEKSRSNTRSWSNVLKIGKKKAGGETPSLSELSTASETTGDDYNDDN